MAGKWVYFFGEGDTNDKALLGGKGANLGDMCRIGLPVPPGFTITTEACVYYFRNSRKNPEGLKEQAEEAMGRIEKSLGRRFGDPKNPLLVSVRSGARKSMPGMMETVLNIGLNEETIKGLIGKTKNPRFAWDSYRRLIQMYSDVVMEKAAGIEPAEGMGVRQQLERELEGMKRERGCTQDVELTAEDMKRLVSIYKKKVKEALGKPFPEDPWEQLWGGIGAVFQSWNGRRAVAYRRIEKIPDDWGTAVNVQAMVFGNMGESSATGVAFTRNPATGENIFYGEWLPNAQGEDVVAGIRTPNSLNEASKTEHSRDQPSLEKAMPGIYKELFDIRNKLERHYGDMQDIEFTIESGRLWMLQTRSGKRNGPAAVRMAVDMLEEKLITREEAVMRVTPEQLDELLHPILDPKAEQKHDPIAKGLPAGPGGAVGMAVFTAAEAVKWAKAGRKVILVREETNPEDVEGMRAAQAVLTARGGMTSHAALVARGWGKCCIVGASGLGVDARRKEAKAGGRTFREGDWISLNGTRGYVYEGELPLVKSTKENIYFKRFMDACDGVRSLGVRTNADTPDDAAQALAFGAEGIGLFRTEHMFYGKGSEEPLFRLRKMIVSKTLEERKKALEELFPYVKKDIKSTFEVMAGLPVTIRLLDPPLHEFVPHEEQKQEELARSLGIGLAELKARADSLRESNPMMGHRGVRLGITYPEITEMQVRAVFEAAAELIKEGKKVKPEIMIPVTSTVEEIRNQKAIIERVHREAEKKSGLKIPFSTGTMIEIPRACLVADRMAEEAEFFSFGTNDLTQMGFGFSRDDMGGFLPSYLSGKILEDDPFKTIDQEGIGQLIRMAVERGRKTRPDLKIGICGEQGGEPRSVEFCHRAGLNYVSCSPFRVPIARLAAAQAAVKEKSK